MVIDSTTTSFTYNCGLDYSSTRVNSTRAVALGYHNHITGSSVAATLSSTQEKANVHLKHYLSQQESKDSTDLNQLLLPTRFRDHLQSRKREVLSSDPQDPLFSKIHHDQTSATTSMMAAMTNATDTQRSPSIPIHRSSTHLKRSPSEAKLSEDQQVADWRDYVMFSRIVNHLVNQQGILEQDSTFRRENDMTLAHIIGTRNESLEATIDPTTSSENPTYSNVASFLPDHLFPSNNHKNDEEDQDCINHVGCFPHQHLHRTRLDRSPLEEEPIFELEM